MAGLLQNAPDEHSPTGTPPLAPQWSQLPGEWLLPDAIITTALAPPKDA
jgi:hypothetical protein